MSILTWIEEKKRLKVLNAPKYVSSPTDSSKGLWTRCDKCGVILYIKHLKENQRVCFGCSYHLQMMSQERIENLLDKVPAIASLSSSSFGVSKGLGARSPAQAPLRGKSSCRSSSSPFLPLLDPSGHRTAPKKMALAKPFASVALGGKGMVSTWRPLDETVSPCDPLRFHDQKNYTDRLKDAQERTGLQDAIQTGTGMIDGIPVALAVMDFSFMGGSMGSVVGEKVTRLIEYATQEGLTLLIVSASGGARMQEGVFSLMQMAKISSSLQIYQSCAKLLYISILTSPTTGGVTASFAMLGDIIFAEPKALIAFAGRRVIEQTLAEDLPEDFQTSESMLHHGLVDLIVPRRFLRQALSETIRLYQNAPFKKIGIIPFGVQNPITFLTEEKIRRQWGTLTKAGTKEISKNEFKSSTSSNQSTIGSKHPYNANVNLGLQKLQKERRISRSNKIEANVFTAKDFQKNTEYTLEGELSSPSTVYRDILTSFEVMLNLFASGKTKNENISFSVLDQVNPLRAPLGQEGAGSFATKVTKSSLHVPCQSTPFTEGVLGGFANKPFTEGVGAGSKATKIGKKDGQSALKRGKKACSKSIKNDGIDFLRVQNGKNSVNLRSFCRAPFFLFLPPLAVPCPFGARRGKKGHGTTPQRGSLHHSKAVIDHSGAVMQGKSFDNNKTVIKPVRFKNTDFLQNGDRQKIETSNGTSHIDTTQKIMFRLSKNEFQKHNSYKQDLEKNRVVFKNAQKGQYQKLVKALYQNNLQQIKKLQNENEIMTLPEGAGSFATKDKRDMFCPFFSAWPYNKTDRSLLLHNFRFFSESFVSKNFEESRQGLNFNSLSERFPKRSGVFANKNDNVSSNVIKLADQNADINFLNQAIELAATDSVEWRCFYIHQQLAENIGFLEDFLQQDHDSRKKNGNLLFYKSICRSEKTVAEQSY